MFGVIVNPNSRKNKKDPARIDRVRDAAGDIGRVVVTRRLEEIGPALESFYREGRLCWVADGGDGALHWLINEAITRFGVEETAARATFLPTGGGTIDFVASAIGIRADAETLIRRLRRTAARGRSPRTVEVPSIRITGAQRTRTGVELDFDRIGFGNSLAGYGANFFGPFYRSDRARGPVRIVTTCAAAFGTAAGRSFFPGPLRVLKPGRLRRAEHDYLRPALAEVRIDETPLVGRRGVPVREHTVIQCASIPLNLGGVFRVFPAAGEGFMHVQAGHVTATQMARFLPGLMTGRIVGADLPGIFDGRASRLDVTCLQGTAMEPVLDGEIFTDIVSLTARMGPTFRMVVP